MNWIEQQLETLSDAPICGYRSDQTAATEPTALAVLALCAHARPSRAIMAARWLAGLQSSDGSVGVREGEPTPHWPTGLAVLAWQAVAASIDDVSDRVRWQPQIERAVQWILATKGKPLFGLTELGHDTTLVAWPWVEGTHSWIEPTALCVMALKATGHSEHPRTREAVQMLFDRQLPGGGCNYGNTTVLGQQLRPHLQATGLAMAALTGEQDSQNRIAKSLAYLRSTLGPLTPVTSLCWGLLGLAAHGQSLPSSSKWLETAFNRTQHGDKSPYKFALLLLAAGSPHAPFYDLSKFDSFTGSS
jgi:hypothetical protein